MVLAPAPPLTVVNPADAAWAARVTFDPEARTRSLTPWTPPKESLIVEAPFKMSALPWPADAWMVLAPSSAAFARMKVVGASVLPIKLSPPLRTWLASMVTGVLLPATLSVP